LTCIKTIYSDHTAMSRFQTLVSRNLDVVVVDAEQVVLDVTGSEPEKVALDILEWMIKAGVRADITAGKVRV
jgi:hypothetical protein